MDKLRSLWDIWVRLVLLGLLFIVVPFVALGIIYSAFTISSFFGIGVAVVLITIIVAILQESFW